MTSPLRIAVPENLRAAAASAAGTAWRVIPAAPAADARQRQRWQRLWQERRGGGGGSLAEAEAALEDASVRALLLLLDRQADAALLSEADPGCEPAWRLLEPCGVGACVDLWCGDLAGEFGWVDWPGSADVSVAAERLRAGAAEMTRGCNGAAVPTVVSFAGGRNPLQSQVARFLQTLQARQTAKFVALYSPLFYGDGRLNATALLQRVRSACSLEGTPVLCVPQLSRAEFASALAAAGGRWAGPFRAGAEAPVARIASDAEPGRISATLAWLARFARTAD